MFNRGDRIELVKMDDDPCPIPPGTRGTIRDLRPMGRNTQVWIDWDIPRSLACIIPPDELVIVEKASSRNSEEAKS
ncbi:protein of unknown function [Faunimonas pinastri]|uniref:DUF4314 domain-containing protein n=1 Tax=Faunimonas pinastri TaxID=1855383 RepID=A0A1H9MVJ1_9HYPH|nr:DUF4314 domain-containing protein [Faunimonas pinastri]SER27688.1 protein of unknown function [Faunimonas pinastri]